MSTPISKALLAAAALLLAACDGGYNVTKSAPGRIQLPDGLIVSGARGWCVDTSTSRTGRDTSVVVLGSCAAIAGNAFAPRPDVPGVVTVSVETTRGDVPPVDVLQTYLASAAGRATLARNGKAGSVRILDSRRTGDMLLVHIRDASGRPAPGADNEYWRALFGLDGRFVTVSLVGLEGRPIDEDKGFETLVDQVEKLRAANRS